MHRKPLMICEVDNELLKAEHGRTLFLGDRLFAKPHQACY